MITRVGKWGNSFAIRFPREIVDALKLRRGEVVSIDSSPDGKHLIIRRVKGITPKERGST